MEAQFLWHELKEEKRNTLERAWIHRTRIEELQEAISLKGKLKVMKKTI